MKALLCMMLSLPGVASAWERVDPARPDEGVFTVVNITDVVVAGDRFVGMAGDDPAAGCRQVLNRAPDASVDDVMHRGRFLRVGRIGTSEVNALIPIVLFARAHNVRVYVRVIEFNRACAITEIRTCFDPATCQ
jgi:hypothetical protein